MMQQMMAGMDGGGGMMPGGMDRGGMQSRMGQGIGGLGAGGEPEPGDFQDVGDRYGRMSTSNRPGALSDHLRARRNRID